MIQKSEEEDLTIIVPIFNEIEVLPRLIDTLRSYLSIASMPCRVLLVDDGSTDGSRQWIKSNLSEDWSIAYIFLAKNSGLSAAIKAGFDFVNTMWTGYIDADLQTHPEDFERLWSARIGNDLVTGVRAMRNDGWVKRMSSKFANSIRRAFTHDGMDDTGCPLKLIRTDVAQRIPMFSGLHRFLPAMVLLQQGRIRQMPVPHYPRIEGRSKYHLWNRLLGPLLDCFAYLWMKRKYINYQVSEYHNV